jgi:DNA-directed RNA polymerase sigma subunit (sigma70/sigma32)
MPIKKIRDDLSRIKQLRECPNCKLTHEDIGKIFGVTKQRIKQILKELELSTEK